MITVNIMFHDGDKYLIGDAIQSVSPRWNIVLQKNIKGNCTNKIRRISDNIITIDNYYTGDFNFATARNNMRIHSRTDWVLSLDADERLLTHQHYQIEELLKIMPEECGSIGVLIISPCDYDNDRPAHEGVPIITSTAARLNKQSLVWQHSIHETVIFDMERKAYKLFNSGIIIHHLGYSLGADAYYNKLKRNFEALKCLDYGQMTAQEHSYYREKLMITEIALTRQARSNKISYKYSHSEEVENQVRQFQDRILQNNAY